MATSHGPTQLVPRSARELREQHHADEEAAAARLEAAMRQGHVILQDWRPDGPDEEAPPAEGELRDIAFIIPETAEEAWRQLIRADCWPDTPEEREDFLWNYHTALQRQAARPGEPS
jgi:hypothetical protein